MDTKDAISRARENKTVIPAFNIPYLPMLKAVAQAIVDENTVAMIHVARLEWEKFQAESLEAVAEEYAKYANPEYTLLHLDHVPVIDEDMLRVDYMPIFKRAIDAGYKSVMIDASRLDLRGNIDATKEAAELVHAHGMPIEAELGAVIGHESGETPPYEELFASKRGFTDVEEARIFARESGCDWLSVAAGSIHGAIAEGLKDKKKPEARLDIEHIKNLEAATGLPLVLHGGSGIRKEYIVEAIKSGIVKINVGTEIRQAYEQAFAKNKDVEEARESCYQRTREVISQFLDITNNRTLLFGK